MRMSKSTFSKDRRLTNTRLWVISIRDLCPTWDFLSNLKINFLNFNDEHFEMRPKYSRNWHPRFSFSIYYFQGKTIDNVLLSTQLPARTPLPVIALREHEAKLQFPTSQAITFLSFRRSSTSCFTSQRSFDRSFRSIARSSRASPYKSSTSIAP